MCLISNLVKPWDVNQDNFKIMSNNYLTIKLDKKALASATTGQSDPNTTNTSNTWDIFFALAFMAINKYFKEKKGWILFQKQEIAQI